MGEVITTTDVTENESLLVELGRRMASMEDQLAKVANGKSKASF